MILFPLTITKSNRLFGGYEYVNIGNKLLKIPINEKFDYGTIIKLADKNNILKNNFNTNKVFFKLSEQAGNSSRRNIYMGLPLLSTDFEKGTSVIIKVRHKKFRVNIPAKSKENNIIRLKNLVEKININIQGDLFLTLLKDNKKSVIPKKNKMNINMYNQSLDAEIIINREREFYDNSKVSNGTIYEIISEPSFTFSIIFGFPYIIQFKFEKRIGGNKTIKMLN